MNTVMRYNDWVGYAASMVGRYSDNPANLQEFKKALENMMIATEIEPESWDSFWTDVAEDVRCG